MSTELSQDQKELLRRELSRDDLSIYTAVVMARQALELGRYAEAVSRLRVDADKIRMHSRELYDLINY
ncbi:hypothetical protein ACM7YY_09955 [Pseudomonas aeruginosa]